MNEGLHDHLGPGDAQFATLGPQLEWQGFMLIVHPPEASWGLGMAEEVKGL